MSSPVPRLPDVDRLLADREWLRALARSLVVDPATADDLAQDATVVALTRPPRSPEALRGWLRRVVTNLSSNTRRGAGRRAAHEAAAGRPEAVDHDPSDVVVRWELRKQVVDAVLGLDEPYRTTVLLRFFEERTTDDIAAHLGVPADTVKTRQRRALEMLRARLAHLDDGAGRRGMAVLLVLARPDAGGGGAAGSGATAGSTAAVVTGGLAMATMVKGLVAVVLVATIAAGVWLVRTGDGGGSSAGRSDAGGRGDVADASGRGRAARPGAGAPGAAASTPAPAPTPGPADADADLDVAGVVVDRAGLPVAGAEVVAHDLDRMTWVLAASRGAATPPGRELARRTTAADGTFAVRVGEGGDVTLRVATPGFATVEAPGQQAGARLKIVLGPATTLRVSVRDGTGAPQPGASVRAYGRDREGPAWILRTGVTAADGTVAWDGLPRSPGISLQIDVAPGAGRAPSRTTHTMADADVNEVVVSLAPGNAVEGRVFDADVGVALAGAEIGVDVRRPAVATTDASGAFRVEGWTGAESPSNSRLFARAAGFAPEWIDVPATPGGPLEFRLRRGFDVAGYVVREGGMPLAGARIVGSERGADGMQSVIDTESGTDGSFRLGAFGTRGVALLVHAAGFANAAVAVATPPRGVPTADVGSVVLGPGRVVRGSVVGAGDVGAAGVQVELTDAMRDATGFASVRRVTNNAGRFAFPRVAPGRYRLVANTATRPVPSADVVVTAAEDPAPVTLRAVPEAAPTTKYAVRTLVVDEDGRPVAGVRAMAGYVASGDARGESGDGGNLRIDCAYEPMFVSAYLSREQSAMYLHPHIWLRPGQTDVEFVLRRAEPIAGVVVDAEGVPVHRAWVTALVGLKQVGAGETDAQGRFAIGVPPGATVLLSARAQEDRDNRRPPPFAVVESIRAGTSDVRIVVRPVTQTRSLDVVIEGELPPDAKAPFVTVSWDGMDWRAQPMATVDANSHVRFRDVPCAPLRVTAQFAIGDGTSVGLPPVRVDGTATILGVRVPALRSVRGVVVDEGGLPVAAAAIFTTAGGVGSSARADADGRFTLSVPADVELPFPVYGNPIPPDLKKPVGGWDLVEDWSDRELRIVVRPVPAR